MEEKETVLEETKEEVKVETSEKKSGSNKVLIVIIVILLLIIAIGFGYFLGNGNSNSDDKESDKVVEENKEEEVQLEQLTKDSEVVKKLFDVFKEVENDSYYLSGDYDLSKLNVRKTLVYAQLRKNGKTTEKSCGSLSKLYVDEYFCDCYNFVYNDETGDLDYPKTEAVIKNSKTTTFTKDDFEAKYLELFGQNAEYKDESFIISDLPGGYAYFDEQNNIYAHFANGSGGEGTSGTHTLDSIEQNGTSLKLLTTLTVYDRPTKKIDYNFEYEKETGNYIFVSRVEK